MPHIIVGTAGHIDHGKTSLVKAITGTDADRLKEEKERGITIDIGFASLALDDETTIGFVDVPGHERFIKNMLAGVGGIDMVMLVIAADESVMPQTREHVDICSLLRIRHGFTVLTKIDTVDPELVDLVEMEVREYLKGSFLEHSPILRASAMTGEGLPRVIDTLREYAGRIAARDSSQIFRLPVDRCFTMKGFGTVVTGTLISGRIGRDDEVEIFPSQRRSRVRGIQVHGRSTTEARAGQRTALNLQGVEVAEIHRGMVLAEPGIFVPTSMLDCHLELLPSAPGPIRLRKRIRFHAGTAELMGYVVLLGRDVLEPGESAYVQIRTEEPTLVLPGDRFIIRQYSPMRTIGGGEILDAHPRKHRRSDPAALARLDVLRNGAMDDRLMLFIEEAGLQAVELRNLAGRTGIAFDRLRERLAALAQTGRIRRIAENPPAVVAQSKFAAALDRIEAGLKEFHRANPLAVGIPREELKGRAASDVPTPVFQALLDQLVADRKVTLSQELVHEYGRKVTLKADEERVREQLIQRLEAAGVQAPSIDDIVAELKLDRATARKIAQLLVKENVLVKVTEDMYVHRAVMDKLIADVRALKARNPKLGVGEFKELTGVTRKHAIPVLEYLDRQRITRRIGDERVIL